MRSVILPASLLATAMSVAVFAQPQHLAHQPKHHARAPLQKRDTVVYTELVIFTECVNVTVTSTIGPDDSPTTIVPAAINTAPQTTLLGPSTVKDAPAQLSPSKGGVFNEQYKPSPPIVSPPAVSSVVVPPVQVPTNVTPCTTTTTTTTTTKPSAAPPVVVPSPSVVVPSPSPSPSTPSGPPSSPGMNLYGLALPPTKKDWSSQCMSAPCTGKATYYNGLNDDMCCGYSGMAGQDGTMRIAALPVGMMGSSSNSNGPGMANQPTNGNCGRMIAVKCPSTGKETTVQVVDKCMGCVAGHLDMSEAAFAALGISQSTGTLEVEWQFIN